MDRKQSMAIYNQLYDKSYPVYEGEVCQYCGRDIDLSLDHVPAITTAHLYARNPDVKFILVWSCMECNQFLSNKLLPLFRERFFRIKEMLLKRYKTDILNEFRSGIDWSEEALNIADKEFNTVLDRIGFGLIRFDELDKESQDIMNLKVDSYDETIGMLISSRTGGGLLLDHVSSKETETAINDDLYISYKSFIELISFLDYQYTHEYLNWIDRNPHITNEYSIPKDPMTYFNKSWSEIWDDAKVLNITKMPAAPIKYEACSLDEFLDIMIEKSIFSIKEYNEWFKRNKLTSAVALMMPEFPDEEYDITWSDIFNRKDLLDIDEETHNEINNHDEMLENHEGTFKSKETHKFIDNKEFSSKSLMDLCRGNPKTPRRY